MRAATDGPTRTPEDVEDYTHDEQDDPERRENPDVEDESEYEQDESKHYHEAELPDRARVQPSRSGSNPNDQLAVMVLVPVDLPVRRSEPGGRNLAWHQSIHSSHSSITPPAGSSRRSTEQ
jgi:hypothetical protein